MLKEIFVRQRQFLNYFFDNINFEEAEQVLTHLISVKGMIIFTGVGKSGIIAEKLSKTMMSTGTRAVFLSAQEALHGDIGIAMKDDLVIMLSKSGKGAEIERVAKSFKKRGVRSMAWVSDKGGSLESIVDYTMHLPLEGEICPFGLAPTTSTALQLIFGDCVAVALMQASKFSLDQYALNHPAGSIGKLIAETVEERMASGDCLPVCSEHVTIQDVLFVLTDKKLGCVFAVDSEEKITGIFTDGDLRRLIEKDGSQSLNTKLIDAMNTEFLTIEKNELTSKALGIMEGEDKKVMVLPVVENEKVVGAIHLHHILSANISSLHF